MSWGEENCSERNFIDTMVYKQKNQRPKEYSFGRWLTLKWSVNDKKTFIPKHLEQYCRTNLEQTKPLAQDDQHQHSLVLYHQHL